MVNAFYAALRSGPRAPDGTGVEPVLSLTWAPVISFPALEPLDDALYYAVQ